MGDKSESFQKGVKLNLDKTFESGLNIGFDSFFGKTEEKGKYNAQPKKSTDLNLGFGVTTKKGTKIRLDARKSDSEGNYYYPKRTEKSVILSLGKSFNTGGDVEIHRKGVVDEDLL